MCKPIDNQVSDDCLFKSIKQWLIVIALLLLVITSLIISGRAETTTIKNSLGPVIENINPFVYLMGEPVRGNIMYDKETTKWATSVTLRPVGAPLLFEQSVLLCGDRVDDFGGLKGTLVITYRRTAHQLYKGVACHELISVSEAVIKDKK